MRNIILTLAGLTLAGTTASAEIISGSPYALGGGRAYYQHGPPATYHVRQGDGFIDILANLDFAMNGPAHMPPPLLQPPSFGASDGPVSLMVSTPGFPPEHLDGSMVCSFFDVFTSIGPDGIRHYDDEMTQFDVMLNMPGMLIRESPTLQSLGKYTIWQEVFVPHVVDGRSTYHIDSFFDIFTEISLDGGQTWTPADQPIHVTLDPVTPAPGAMCLLALGGMTARRRRD